MISSALACVFVCLLAGLHKNYSTFFTKFDGKVSHGPREKPLHFGGNPDHVVMIKARVGTRLWRAGGTAVVCGCYLVFV